MPQHRKYNCVPTQCKVQFRVVRFKVVSIFYSKKFFTKSRKKHIKNFINKLKKCTFANVTNVVETLPQK